jgi:hypothetical protein
MTASGFRHHITENAHPVIPPALARDHNYGLFAARYGNIYTARQLRQLIERAYGTFEPAEDAWAFGGRWVDPFRPQIQPGGYDSLAELRADRAQHLACVRRAFEEMDVFVFTLGLTECWESATDGAVWPLAPGVAGGTYDPQKVRFRNFDEVETTADLLASIDLLRDHNPTVRIILTVSPVPLNATMEDRHVFVSTTWSKAVLRIAAEKARNARPDVCYFPSFEVITSPHVRGRYYAQDGREVLTVGVDHVMGLFFRHFAGVETGAERPAEGLVPSTEAEDYIARMQEKVEVLCDEEMINNAV